MFSTAKDLLKCSHRNEKYLIVGLHFNQCKCIANCFTTDHSQCMPGLRVLEDYFCMRRIIVGLRYYPMEHQRQLVVARTIESDTLCSYKDK